MGIHNKVRVDKHGDPVDANESLDRADDNRSASFSAMDHMNSDQEIPIDDPS